MSKAALAALAALVLLVLTGATPPPRLWSAAPTVSPDGRHIAFLADRDSLRAQVCVIGADGAGARQLTRGAPEKSRPTWSADGAHVRFATFERDSGRLFSVNLKGGDLRQLVAVPGRNPILLDGGRRVLFSTGGWTATQWSASALDGSGLTPVTDGAGVYWAAALSPDGKQIAFTYADSAGRLSVRVMASDGTGARTLPQVTEPGARPQCPAWSADGRRIAFQVNRDDPQDRRRRWATIWVADLASGALTPLAPHEQPWLDELPSWFPDGRHLAFQSTRGGEQQVWVMASDGTGLRQVTK